MESNLISTHLRNIKRYNFETFKVKTSSNPKLCFNSPVPSHALTLSKAFLLLNLSLQTRTCTHAQEETFRKAWNKKLLSKRSLKRTKITKKKNVKPWTQFSLVGYSKNGKKEKRRKRSRFEVKSNLEILN